jgi:hypothetical protein
MNGGVSKPNEKILLLLGDMLLIISLNYLFANVLFFEQSIAAA